MASRVVIVGAGGHGREVLDVIEAVGGHEVVGFVDDGSPDLELLAGRGVPLLGPTSELEGLGEVSVVLGIGDSRARADVAARIGTPPAPAMVHPAASVGSRCTIAPGAVVAAGARLTTNVTVGLHAYIGPNAAIGHDTVLEDFASVYPGAVVSGDVALGRAATVGAGATVKQGVRVGERAMIGMGAAATHDVPAHTTVVGVPARRIGPR
jgi:sugar O-acyltransferase (sialic acid O-acetyltransferase NeuD family)